MAEPLEARRSGAVAGFLAGGGETGRLIAARDWSDGVLGPVEGWPPCLVTALLLVVRSPVPMLLLWGADGIMLYNDAYSEFAGDRHPELLGLPVLQGWPASAAFHENVVRTVLGGGTLSYQDREITLVRDGRAEQVFTNLDYSPVLDETGVPAGAICILRETTERVLVQRATTAERDRQRLLLQQMPGFAAVLAGPDHRYEYVNDAYVAIGGDRQFVGRTVREVFPELEGQRFYALLDEAYASGNPFSARAMPVQLDRDDGERFVDFLYAPIRDDSGAVSGIFVGGYDVTTQVRSEAHYRKESDRTSKEAAAQSAILSQLGEGVIVTNAAGEIMFVNLAAERLHGVKMLGIAPEAYSDSYHLYTESGDPHPTHELPLARAVLQDETVQEARWRIHRADGSAVLAIGNARPVYDKDSVKIGAVLTIRDDTERSRIDAEMRESRDRLASESRALEILNEIGKQVAAELDLETLVQQVVDAGSALVGAEFGAFFYNVLDDRGDSYMLYALAGAQRSDFDGFGMPRATAVFAPTFRGEGVIRSDDILQDPRYGLSAPHHGMPAGHLPVRSYLAVPVTSRSGEVIGGLFFGHAEPAMFSERSERLIAGLAAQAAIGIDNARLFEAVQRANAELEARVALRTAELEQAHAALRQSQKMEAVGQLTGGIAHDFNNMLAVVIGALDLLARRIDGHDERARRYVEAAADGARRAALLTQRLLAFARQQPLRPEVLDANKMVAGMSDLLRRSLGAEIRLETVLAGGLWRTHADPNQLENLLLNLAVNARDAMAEGGWLTIETQNAHLDDRYAATELGVVPGQYVMIAVTDTGSGMSQEVIAKAFDPFFTTKPIGKGTGLGLSQVYGFVRQSEGHVRIYSEPGHGTTIKVYLPRFIRDDAETAAEAPRVDPPSGDASELILVVEDEEAVRRLSVDALVELGYRVVEADGAAAALVLLDAHADIVLLFTDIVMPDTNGRKLADEALRRRPALKVLFTTGYTRNAVVHNGVVDPGVELIGKPFTVDELAAKVRRVLDGG